MTKRGKTTALSIAPTMERTDRHYRYMMRLISRRTLLYTEMVTAKAILHGDRPYLLGFDPAEAPVSLQLGGDEPGEMAECARIAEDWGYDEVNINVGCPSARVKRGNFGACLMTQPEVVAACVEAMRGATTLPVTVKHRIGVDDLDSYEDMLRFVDVVAAAGADRFTVHARKAWLSGLSPKENRNVPPLRHHEVHQLKEERPALVIETNGGIKTLEEVGRQLEKVDAVMVGRAAYDDPWMFSAADREIFGEEAPSSTRREVIEEMVEYADRWVRGGGKLHHISRHMLNLYRAVPGAKMWRRYLSEHAPRWDGGGALLLDALTVVEEEEARVAAFRASGPPAVASAP